MKKIFFLVVCLSLASLIWANGVQDKKEENFQDVSLLTSSAKFKEAYRAIALKMEQEEGLQIDIQVIPDDQYQNLIQIKLTSNEVPDVLMQNAPEQYFAMKAKETMVDLSDQPWVSKMLNPGMVTDKEGKVWAMPQESGSFFGACYYNMDLLDELGIEDPAPKTFNEFVDLLKEIKIADTNVVPLYMNHRDSWTTQIFMTAGYSIALGDDGPTVYGDIMENKRKFSDVPEFKAVLKQFKTLIDEKLVNQDHLSAGYDDGLAAVASGKSAMVYNGEWVISGLEAEGARIGAFPIPWTDNDLMSTGAYVQGFFIPNKANNIEGALKFLELYSSSEYMDIYYDENPGFPAFKNVNGGDVNPELMAMVNKYMENNATVYQMNDFMAPLSALWGELWGAYVEYAAGNMDVDEVLKYWDDVAGNHMETTGQAGW
ncbi:MULTISPECIES: ABC transporter substrate-binding protein [unclassified Oceanispirochaeta]|uniref:ABC transporter substrate-binding protein n=1 Tax=unclassified Oceanispirochaeta TaxID=2635722 RepID=UPI000E0920E4|nr:MULTISPECIES: extracellular solute-binding protein [unclassified Oceanispirochaeta]MBF9016545.1 extracellular solute-binding protein [Oceanispirochaeta sp. M2]NPD73007.1 extracellular solute-binding protein [Oceanispirochaeta sp. M1]RDG31351.1 extracellular solute-binding protein [Oceanispirochaeta sp. M1]